MSVELLSGLLAAVIGVIGGYYALVKIIVGQFEKRLDERFATQEHERLEGRRVWEEMLDKLDDGHRSLERDHMKLLAELPREYVRRDDHIRFETVINAKLDALSSEMRLLAERAQVRA